MKNCIFAITPSYKLLKKNRLKHKQKRIDAKSVGSFEISCQGLCDDTGIQSLLCSTFYLQQGNESFHSVFLAHALAQQGVFFIVLSWRQLFLIRLKVVAQLILWVWQYSLHSFHSPLQNSSAEPIRWVVQESGRDRQAPIFEAQDWKGEAPICEAQHGKDEAPICEAQHWKDVASASHIMMMMIMTAIWFIWICVICLITYPAWLSFADWLK